MISSYLNKDLDYGEILKTICYLKEPKLIITDKHEATALR